MADTDRTPATFGYLHQFVQLGADKCFAGDMIQKDAAAGGGNTFFLRNILRHRIICGSAIDEEQSKHRQGFHHSMHGGRIACQLAAHVIVDAGDVGNRGNTRE